MSSPAQHIPRTGNLLRPVPSSNILSRLGTPEVTNNVRERRVAQLPISKNLDAFEQTLSSLLTSISKYTPNVADAEKLVEINKEVTASLEDIIAHQRLGLDIDSLEAQSAKVDKNCGEILVGLADCRKKLAALPSLEKTLQEEKRMKETNINADELLTYAMKLAKFTTAPPTFDAGSIGPNNFIWPAEDMLRRGMLAISSLNSAKLLGEESEQKEEDGLIGDGVENGDDDDADARRGSFGGSYGGAQQGSEDDVLDLDLFDPDEE